MEVSLSACAPLGNVGQQEGDTMLGWKKLEETASLQPASTYPGESSPLWHPGRSRRNYELGKR